MLIGQEVVIVWSINERRSGWIDLIASVNPGFTITRGTTEHR